MQFTFRQSSQLKIKPDISQVQFGSHISDHIFVADYEEGFGWINARIIPYSSFQLEPTALVLHYGQSIFEGLKAYRQPDGAIALFRPDQNFHRMNRSAARMAMPEIPEDLFNTGLHRLISVEQEWVPATRNASLYVRPIMFANEAALGVRRSSRYVFCIMLCPVPSYFNIGDKPFKLLAREDFSRTAQGGVGNAKTSANYGQSIIALEEARREGFDNLLWLDAAKHQWIEEAGITNIFIKYSDKVVTPPLSGRILPGITRASVIDLLRHQGVSIIETETTIEDLVRDIDQGLVHEIFLTGTATVVAPVDEIGFRGKRFKLTFNSANSLATSLYQTLTGIQNGTLPDHFDWMSPLVHD